MKSNTRFPVITGTLTFIALTFSLPAAEPETTNPTQPDRGVYRDNGTGKGAVQSGKEREASPHQFLRSALLGGFKEVRISQIALERSQNPEIKTFAQRMIQEHSKLNQQLTELAQTKGWTAPETNVFDSPTSNLSSTTSDQNRGNRTKPVDRTVSNQRRSGTSDSAAQERDRVDGKRDGTTVERYESEKAGSEARWEGMVVQNRNSVDALKNESAGDFDKAYVRESLRSHKASVRRFEQASQNSSDAEVKKLASDALPSLKEHHQMATRLAQSLGVNAEHDQDGKKSTRESDKKNQN